MYESVLIVRHEGIAIGLDPPCHTDILLELANG